MNLANNNNGIAPLTGDLNFPLIQPENLAHHGTASSLNYKDWDSNDVLGWLEEHLKLPQYKEVFGKISNFYLTFWIGGLGIDGSLLDHIRDEDLQTDFGISVRLHRVKIIEGIKKLQV